MLYTPQRKCREYNYNATIKMQLTNRRHYANNSDTVTIILLFTNNQHGAISITLLLYCASQLTYYNQQLCCHYHIMPYKKSL